MAIRVWAKAIVPLVVLIGACTNGAEPEEATPTTADFESERSAPADGLTDVDWVIALVEIDGESVEPPPDNRTSITLSADGNLAGGGGCNQFDGQWETSGEDAIDFKNLGLGETDCGEIEDWDTAVQLLGEIDTWQIDDLTLVLTNANDDRIVAVAS